jgi:hypothetical protein
MVLSIEDVDSSKKIELQDTTKKVEDPTQPVQHADDDKDELRKQSVVAISDENKSGDSEELRCSFHGIPTGNETCFLFPKPELENPTAAQWIRLAFWIVLPGTITFTYSACTSLWKGQWWAIAYNLPYNTPDFKIPTIFEIHFCAALCMLACIIAQLSAVFFNKWTFHEMNGNVVVMVITAALIPGVVGLALCDTAPKKGVEMVFFVQLGICILLTTVKAYNVIKNKKPNETPAEKLKRHQSHMRYMVWNMMLIFSPAYNRIWQMFWRNVNGWSPTCYQILTFTRHGVSYTPSFALGLGYSFIMWAFVYKYPMFKVGELGWWQFWYFFCTFMLCLGQTIHSWREEYDRLHDCTYGDYTQYSHLMNGTLGDAYFATNMYMSVCHSSLNTLYILPSSN